DVFYPYPYASGS
nr:Chain P, 12-mer peptide [synthetic construct]1JYI_Q Chain Q, 12-mer peptide [synthetic construct]1JYI_R Chain R, 12-mer peptide [synthetic construct]1JYI_S Chain S, 12-mer peptide [synthetic construct]4H0H_D Chain D, peptide [synthetic construct]